MQGMEDIKDFFSFGLFVIFPENEKKKYTVEYS